MLDIAAGNKAAFRELYLLSYGKVAHYVKGFVKDESLAGGKFIELKIVLLRHYC